MASVHLATRILREFSRSRRVLWLWVVFPLSMLLLFGWVRVEELGGFAPAFTFTAPGILIGAALFFSCLGGPVSVIVGERERGTLDRLRAARVSGREYFVGLTLAHLAIAFGQAFLVFGPTYLLGGRIGGSLVGGVGVLVLCATGYVGAGFIVGTRASGPEEINGTVAGIGVPLLVLGGTFFPVTALPPVLLAAAQLNPVYHMNQAFTTVVRGEVGLGGVWPSAAFLVAFTAVGSWVGARSFEREFLSGSGPRG